MKNATKTARSTVPAGNGRRRLLDAALRLAGRDGVALSALGLRELAREAGLNHNTFYRHFRDVDDFGEALAEEVAADIMAGLKEVRRRAETHADATRGSVEYFLRFVEENPRVFRIGMRELHSAGAPMRKALLRVLDGIAQESVDQITSMNLAPGLDRDTLFRTALDITYYMLYRALDYLERPAERLDIEQQMVRFIRTQFFGAAALLAAQSGQAPLVTRTT